MFIELESPPVEPLDPRDPRAIIYTLQTRLNLLYDSLEELREELKRLNKKNRELVNRYDKLEEYVRCCLTGRLTS